MKTRKFYRKNVNKEDGENAEDILSKLLIKYHKKSRSESLENESIIIIYKTEHDNMQK